MAAIGKAIADGISSGFSGTSLQGIKDQLSGLYTSASAAAKVSADIIGSVFGSPTAELNATGGLAGGTSYASAGWHNVGEQGTERVYLPQGARVTNAVNTSRSTGSAGNNITLAPVFNSPKAMNQYEQMRALKQYNRDMAFQGVI
jgi:SLT domain-containing protein